MDNDPKETKQLTTGEEGDNRSLMERVKQTGGALKERAIEEAKEYKDPQDTQLWKSIFRVSHDRSDPRNRSLAILSNVFLHLHPAKINRDAVRYPFTWGMGGITFYLFIVLTFTGVLLMFYYHPTKTDAFRDILYLEHDVPFGKLLRNMHRWAAHLMVITTWLHMFRVVLTGSYKRPREFNWCVAAVIYGISFAGRSARFLGGNGGNKHGARDADAGS
jgi:quinol-cytochrome oxidoreductase complex cytochrome b subunit